MNDVRIEPLLERLLSDAPTLRAPDRLRADIAIASGRKRRRPAWLAYLKEPPMRFHSRLVVGSPRIRVATVAAAVAVFLTLGGAALAASSLPPSPTVPTLPSPPYLTNFCDLASLDEVRAILGDEGAAVAHGLGRSKSTGLQSCAVALALDVPAAVDPQLVGQDLWVGREDLGEMIHVDRVSGALGASIGPGAYAQGSPGALWFAVPGDPPTVVRVDPTSGATVATIEVPAGTGCAIAGSVPDALFTSSCFARDAETRTFARIDPLTNTVVATTDVPDTHGGNPVVAGGSTWLVGAFDAPDGSHFAGLVRVDPVSGAAQQWISLPGVEPDGSIGTANAIWIPDEAGHRVLRYDVANVTGP